jgi:hypothetical protein
VQVTVLLLTNYKKSRVSHCLYGWEYNESNARWTTTVCDTCQVQATSGYKKLHSTPLCLRDLTLEGQFWKGMLKFSGAT